MAIQLPSPLEMRGTVRIAGVCLAAGTLWVGLSQPWFRNSEGHLDGRFALALAIAAVFLMLAFAAGTAWRRCAAWSSLALAGQAAALQSIDAGTAIHYQHYRLAELFGSPEYRVFLVFLAAQSLAVSAAVWRRRSAIRAWMKGRLGWWQLVAMLSVCCLAGAAVSRDTRFFEAELLFAAAIELVSLGNIVLVAWTLPPRGAAALGERLESWIGGPDAARPRIDRFAIGAALWATLVSAALAFFVYQAHPHLADEVVYLYNGRYFAAAEATMRPPAVPAAFDIDQMEMLPRQWYSAVPFGWPAALAAGALAGAPWLVNPVLAGVNILLAYLFLSGFYSRRVARIAVLLLCGSPWYLFMGMNFMTHMLTTTFALAGFLALEAARRSGHARWAWLAGGAAGAGSLIRPLDGVIVAGLLGLSAIGLGGRRLKLPSLAALVAGTILVAALIFPYNKALTGDPTLSPLVSYRDRHFAPKSNAYGFGPERGLGWALDAYPGHTPFEALINAELNAASLNVELFGWSTGSLILIGVVVFSGALRRRDWQMLAAVAAVVLAYAPYWFSGGPDFGARYWFLALVPCVALTARGLEWLEGIGGARATVAAAFLVLLSVFNYVPWRSLDKYYHYLDMRPDVRRLARQRGFGRSLVLVRGARFPDYESAAIYNPLDLEANAPVYAWDKNAAVRDELLKAYPDRKVWIVDGPSITHAGFRVEAGPLGPVESAALR